MIAAEPRRNSVATRLVDLRQSEFDRLDAAGHAYLDYTGSGLYARSQIEAHHARLLHGLFGNPHSENSPSRQSTASMERARRRVLTFFHADPAHYDVCFTANASAALRVVGEAFPFGPRSPLVLTADNHNSVHGIRCFAERAGATVRYVPATGPELRANAQPWLDTTVAGGLFAFPAQSNFSGVRHPLGWIEPAREHGFRVLLDAAAYVPTSPLRLDRVAPDFVCVSFYKMFGFPTGVGALIVRHDALAELRRPWFAGGTVDWVSTQFGAYRPRADVGAFEDGTPNFLAFDAVIDGLDLLDRIGMDAIAAHVDRLTRYLLTRLIGLRHDDASAIVTVYGPRNTDARGGTIAFNVRDAGGAMVPFDRVVAAAAKQGVSLRGGCFCNPGAAEAAFALSAERSQRVLTELADNFSIPAFTDRMGTPVGAVRASLGAPTTTGDIDRLVVLLSTYRNRTLTS